MQGSSDKLCIDEIAQQGSPGIYRRISATHDILIEDAQSLKEQLQKQKSKPPLQTTSSLKLNIFKPQEILRRTKSKESTTSPLPSPFSKGQLMPNTNCLIT